MDMGVIKLKRQRAFSLIEVLIVMFIAAVAFTSFYTVSTFGTRYIIESKNRLGAVAFANEKMEIIRNLAYDDVGTQGSISVPGNILQDEPVTANGRSYRVLTLVQYFDDPMDGTTTTSPADAIPNDYKLVEVVVQWVDSTGQIQQVSSMSRFVPPGLETSVNGSPLAINVIDGETLLPIAQASVHISNSVIVPAINDTIPTDNEGRVMLPAAKISTDNHLSITKAGYESLATMDATATFIPVYGHINVVGSFLNTYNYILNRLAKLTVKTADYQNNPIGNIGFTIGGGKIIGHDELEVNLFSMANTTGTTDATEGKREYNNISSGNYSIAMEPNVQYEFIDYDPATFPVFLAPGSDAEYILRMADKNVNALFLEIKNSDTPSAAIAGAKVTLTDGATDIFTEKLSSQRGVVFYPDGAVPLDAKEYTLKIEIDGYNIESRSVTIDKLTHVTVQLTKI